MSIQVLEENWKLGSLHDVASSGIYCPEEVFLLCITPLVLNHSEAFVV